MVSPTRNLPPEAEPWGRYIETELAQVKFDANKNAQDISNSLSSINGTLTQLSGQVASISAAVAAAASAAADAAAAAALANAAIANLLSVGSVGNSSSGFNHTASGNYAISNITVPIGYTSATILCVVDTTASVSSGIGAFNLSASIGGTTGGTSSQSLDFSWNFTASASGIRTLTGLTGGSTIAVAANISSGTGAFNPTFAVANCNAIAIFTK